MTTTKKKIAVAFTAASFALTACAKSPDKISATYVSPVVYQNYSCDQLRAELMRVSARVSEVSGQQKSAANKDAVAMGVGLVLFWPALFFLAGGNKKEELARLKGEYEAVEQTAIQKDCSVAQEIREQRAAAEQAAESEDVVAKD